MNEERSFERFVADNVAGTSQGTPLPDDFYDDMHSFATTTRQRPEWLALIKEPPMRSNNHSVVGSPTARVAAIVIATMLLMVTLAAAGVAGQRLLAADDDAADIVVAQDGSGDFATISEAIDAASDGDEILVRAGEYVEALFIDKDIKLHGEDRDSVRIMAPEDGPTYSDYIFSGVSSIEALGDVRPFVILLEGADAELGGITIVQTTTDQIPLTVSGGGPTISDVGHDYSLEWERWHTLYIDGGQRETDDRSTTTIRDSEFGGWIVVEEASSVDVAGTRAVRLQMDTEPDTSSRISDSSFGSLRLTGSGIAQGNRLEAIEWQDFAGIDIDDGDWMIQDNELKGYEDGIVANGDSIELVGNTLTDNTVGITLVPGDHAVIGNRVTGGDKGIILQLGSTSVEGNSVTGVSGRAMEIKSGATPVLRDNSLCGNDTNLWVSDSADPDVDDSNEICED